jgi:chemotaxis protein MotB
MKHRRKHASHVSHERWLVSYADFITLLFAFFVVLYSTAQVDKRKMGKLSAAIQVAFEQLGAFPPSGSSNLAAKEPTQRPPVRIAVAVPQAPTPPDQPDLTPLREELEKALKDEIARNEVSIRTVPEGLVISLREVGFFGSGSADIQPKSQAAFDRMAALLGQGKYHIRIEGHTDNKPIHTAQFDSNWELSTARATQMVRQLITLHQFPPEALSAAGYGEYHPIASNDTEEGRSMNRRVDVVILGKPPAIR